MNEYTSAQTPALKVPATARLFLALLGRIREGHLTLVIPGGQQFLFGNAHQYPGATLVVNDWRGCARLMAAGDIGFAESYRQGWFDTPNLTDLLTLALRNESAMEQAISGGVIASLWYTLLHRLRPNTREGSRRNIHAHYDIGNDFYRLWLDETWTYSSALFDGVRDCSLEAAQTAKYQRIVDRLQLKPGMRVLEIGCGWGGFAIHAAKLGISVHGITISPSQLRVAKERAATAGMTPLLNLELRDYRDLSGQYDAIVSIEMFEAVGERFWSGFFTQLRNLLRPGGRALIQTITIDDRRYVKYRGSSDFIREYIFPGGMLPGPGKFIAAAEKAGLPLRDRFAFGRDYAETLRRWRIRFEASLEAIKAQGFDESFIRLWRLYLAYCEAGFDEARTDVIQFLIERAD